MRPFCSCRLYTFVDTAYLHGRSVGEVAQQLCDGGADLIQLRAKNSSLDQIRGMAEEILPRTTRAGVWLVINDHPAVAAETGAPLCHLGQEDFFDAGHTHVSQLRGTAPGVKIGLSTHGPAQAERSIAAGAEYLAVGPVYATKTKPTARPVALEYVRWAAAHVRIPWFAIGGLNLGNLAEVIAAGACRVCVVSGILNAPDIVQACQQFKSCLPSVASQSINDPTC